MPAHSVIDNGLKYPKTIKFYRYINVYQRSRAFLKRKQCNNYCKQYTNRAYLLR